MIDVNGKNKYREIWLGGRSVSELYYGEHLVWPDNVSPTPEGGNYRYYYTRIDGVSGMSECGDRNLNGGLMGDVLFDYTEEVCSNSAYRDRVDKFYIGDCISSIKQSHNNTNGFYGLKNITLVDMSKSKITSIPSNTFGNAPNKQLKTVIFNDILSAIGDGSFSGCSSLSEVEFPNSLKTIGQVAFKGTAITSIAIPKGIDKMAHSIFAECTKLRRVYGFEDIKPSSLGDALFNGCTSLEEIALPTSFTELGSYMCANCTSLTKVENLEQYSTILNYSFDNCTSLTKINLSPYLTSLGSSSFRGCSSINSDIELSEYVNSIGISCFSGCTNVNSFRIKAKTPPTLGVYVFEQTNNCPIYVPCESVDAYKAATNWSRYADRIVGWDFENDVECEGGEKPDIDDDEIFDGNYICAKKHRDGEIIKVDCSGNGTTSLTTTIALGNSSKNCSECGYTPIEFHIGRCSGNLENNLIDKWNYLEKIYIDEGFEGYIYNSRFINLPQLKEFYINGHITELIAPFSNVPKLERLVVNGSIDNIGSGALPYVSDGIYLYQDYVPNYRGTSEYLGTGNIYVNPKLLDEYKNDEMWSYTKNKIFPIPET